MPFPFGEAPTLRQFIETARAHGAELRHMPTVIEGPNGPVRFTYLWIDAQRFVPLPDASDDERLAPDMVDHMARRLGIATSNFWPGFEGFGWQGEDGD